MRWRALRHGHARLCPRCSNAPGASGPINSGRRRPSPCGGNIRTSSSWPKSTGTWNGRCSSRGSITPTTSGSTTGFVIGMPGRCASTSGPDWITRRSWLGSWRTTTSRVRRPPFRRTSTKRPRSSLFCRPDCDSSMGQVDRRGGAAQWPPFSTSVCTGRIRAWSLKIAACSMPTVSTTCRKTKLRVLSFSVARRSSLLV